MKNKLICDDNLKIIKANEKDIPAKTEKFGPSQLFGGYQEFYL